MSEDEKYNQLELRVDNVENRLIKVEISLSDMRDEVRRGFADLKTDFQRVYAAQERYNEEKAKWGAWARENIGRVLKWAGWIILAACGINQTSTIFKLVQDSTK